MKKYFLLSITLLISIFVYTDNVNALIETNYADFPDLPTDLSSNYSEQKYAIAKKNDTGDIILLIYNNNTEFLRIWSTMIEENNLLHDDDNNFVISGTYFDSSNRAGNSTYRWYYLRNNKWYFNKELSGTIGVSEIYYFNFQGIEMYNSSSEKIYENFGIKDIEPQLNFKANFISNSELDEFKEIGKVSVEFSELDKNILYDNSLKIKLQFGSNDFTRENIPVFSHFKIYGRSSNEEQWKEISESLKQPIDYLDDNTILYADHTPYVIDSSYDYVENSLADTSITFQIDFVDLNYIDLESTDPLFKYWKIEFYFDNTQNGYLYLYDTLEYSSWTRTIRFLNDYIFYNFPSNYKYAFIVSPNSDIQEGRVYFPTNFINNDLIKLQGQYFNLKSKKFSRPVSYNLYLEDTYYSYIDYLYNINDDIFLLNRALGSKDIYFYYGNDFNPYLDGPIILHEFLNNVYHSTEVSYFYVPIGYNVYFTNNTNLIINSSNGEINIDIENSKNNYESKIEYEDNGINSFLNIFLKSFNYFIEPIGSFLSLITSFFNILPIGIQYMFYLAFGFSIALIIYKFVI